MDFEDIGAGFVAFIIIGLIVGSIWIGITGLHYQKGEGEHTGYITAIETSYNRMTAYVKTDVQSSQEDQYCVIDKSVFAQLGDAAKKKAHVTVSYITWISNGALTCAVPGDIITGVQIDQ